MKKGICLLIFFVLKSWGFTFSLVHSNFYSVLDQKLKRQHQLCFIPGRLTFSRVSHSHIFRLHCDGGSSIPKLDFNEDYYTVLEVNSDINEQDLKKSYYKLVFKFHPDNKSDEKMKILCNKQMMVINGAYKILKDKSLRLEYDKKRSIGLVGGRAAVKVNGKTQTKPVENNVNMKSQPFKRMNENDNIYSNEKKFIPEEQEAVESMGDVFKDIYADFSRNRGKSFLEDALEFLENQVFTFVLLLLTTL